MTTPAAANLYEAQHIFDNQRRKYAVFNPSDKKLEDLPIIYGFNNGGSRDFFSAILIAADGTFLGGHSCSSESYMPADLGILEGTRDDRHVTFRAHYPNGYRMDFVCYGDVKNHVGLNDAFALNKISDGI